MELFDEENIYTMLDEQWENFGTLNDIEDERLDSLADSAVERGELLVQIATMIDRRLTRQESEILRSYFGLQMKRICRRTCAKKWCFEKANHAYCR